MFLQEQSVLLIIDVQGKLAQLMHQRDELFRHIGGLIRVADLLSIPILITEQAPEKIGKTVPEITELSGSRQPIPKLCFSCCGNQGFMKALESLRRKQIIVTGIEAHVCVYQTVSDLKDRRYQVQVVSDAVSSRTDADKQCALDRIRYLGVDVTSTEMIVCELLKTSEHKKFREVIKLIK